MRLFTLGPVEMFPEVTDKTIPYFRTPEFSAIMLDTDNLLKRFAGASDSAKTIYLTASGTAAMEAAVTNCFDETDRLLVINGGTFGQRFADICRIHKIPHIELNLPYGETLEARHFAPFFDENITGVLVNLHETSVGQLYDIGIIADFCRQKGACLVSDAIGTFLADEYDMAKYGINVTIISSQKGLCIEPGLSIVILDEKTVQERVGKHKTDNLYFDFNSYIKNFERGQTPYTPAVGICLDLNASLHMIDRRGLELHLAAVAETARDFREKTKNLPVTLPKFPLSNAMTPIQFAAPIAYEVFELLKNDYDIFVNPTGGVRHDTVLRIAHIGNLTREDNTYLADCMKTAIEKLTKR